MNHYTLPAELFGPQPVLGDGVSRPLPTEATRQFRFEVQIPSAPLMRVVIPAPTKAKAVLYCKNRWPGATVTPIKA